MTVFEMGTQRLLKYEDSFSHENYHMTELLSNYRGNLSQGWGGTPVISAPGKGMQKD